MRKKPIGKAENKYLRQCKEHNADELGTASRRLRQYKSDTLRRVKASYFNGKIAERKSDRK